jgi:hypothetical protein
MRSVRTSVARRRGRRDVLVATALVAALAATATACNSGDDKAEDKPAATASQGSGQDDAQVPGNIADKLKDHGIDPDQWKSGGWRNWDKDKWLSEAKDFVNPVIKGLWKPDRMKSAKDPDKTISAKDAAADQGVTDPTPEPVQAKAE